MRSRNGRRHGASRPLATCLVAILGLGLAGCGDDDETASFSDDEIRKAVGAETVQGTLAVNGDIFCEIRNGLLNDSGEVSDALDRDDGLVLTSKQGNVGVQVIAPFAPDCERQVRSRLNDLDPTAAMERQERRREEKGDGGGSDGGGSGGSGGEGSN